MAFKKKFGSLSTEFCVSNCRYALGGFDGTTTVSSVEIFDPRLELWMTGEPMNHPRGYSGAALVGETIYVIAGVRGGDNNIDDNMEDTVSKMLH